jgi:hypothetical protein
VLFRGLPAADIRGLDFDGRHVAWATDGCQLVADIASPEVDATPAGPCIRLRPDDIGVVVVRVIDPDGRRRIAVVL